MMSRDRLLLALARATMLGVIGQFLLAGLSLFHDGDLWAAHGTLGGLVGLAVLVIAALVLRAPGRRDLRAPVLRLAGAYGLQVTLAAAGGATGIGAILALHVLNAAFVLGAAASLASATAASRNAMQRRTA